MNYVRQRLIIIFTVGWIAYASTYFLRKPLGVIKSDMENELKFTKSQLGIFDTALLLPYALIQMFLGPLGDRQLNYLAFLNFDKYKNIYQGDRWGARLTFGYCLIAAGISMLTFGNWSNLYTLAFLLFLNGAFQSLCWPSSNKGLAAWVSDAERNTIFGYFGTCPFAGGIIGTAFAVYLQNLYGWRYVHLIPSLFCILMGILVLVLFKLPKELNIEILGKESNISTSKEPSKHYTIKDLWKIPMVSEVAITVFCLKAVRYCMYMWLPMYLQQHLNYSKQNAGMFSTMFEIGGIAGSASVGYVLNRFFDNRPLMGSTVQTFLSALALILFILTSEMGVLINSIVMVLIGFLNCAPDIILCGSFPTELGEMDGRNAASAIIGFVNGFGSIGTFIEGPIIGWISDNYGWSGMFYSMMLISFVGSVTCYKANRIYEIKKKHLTLGNIIVNSNA